MYTYTIEESSYLPSYEWSHNTADLASELAFKIFCFFLGRSSHVWWCCSSNLILIRAERHSGNVSSHVFSMGPISVSLFSRLTKEKEKSGACVECFGVYMKEWFNPLHYLDVLVQSEKVSLYVRMHFKSPVFLRLKQDTRQLNTIAFWLGQRFWWTVNIKTF